MHVQWWSLSEGTVYQVCAGHEQIFFGPNVKITWASPKLVIQRKGYLSLNLVMNGLIHELNFVRLLVNWIKFEQWLALLASSHPTFFDLKIKGSLWKIVGRIQSDAVPVWVFWQPQERFIPCLLRMGQSSEFSARTREILVYDQLKRCGQKWLSCSRTRLRFLCGLTSLHANCIQLCKIHTLGMISKQIMSRLHESKYFFSPFLGSTSILSFCRFRFSIFFFLFCWLKLMDTGLFLPKHYNNPWVNTSKVWGSDAKNKCFYAKLIYWKIFQLTGSCVGCLESPESLIKGSCLIHWAMQTFKSGWPCNLQSELCWKTFYSLII